MILRSLSMLLATGAIAGCAIGQAPVSPTASDLERLHVAEAEALENAQTGQSVNWLNPETGHRGSVTVLGTETDGAQPCRSVQRVFNAGETTRTGRAVLCRTPDGVWDVRREAPLRTDLEEARAREREWRWRQNDFYWDPYYRTYRYGRPPWPYYGYHMRY